MKATASSGSESEGTEEREEALKSMRKCWRFEMHMGGVGAKEQVTGQQILGALGLANTMLSDVWLATVQPRFFFSVVLDTRIHTRFMTDHYSVVPLLLLLFTRKKRVTMHQHPHESTIGATTTASSKNSPPALPMSWSVMSRSPIPSRLPASRARPKYASFFVLGNTASPTSWTEVNRWCPLPLQWLPIQSTTPP